MRFRSALKMHRAKQERASMAVRFRLGPPPKPIILNPRCDRCGEFRRSKIHRAHARREAR